jgi:hypothetical protein
MERLNDWPERLNALIDAWRVRPFEWGKSDCAIFCHEAEIAMFGKSRVRDFSGLYQNKTGAARQIVKNGGHSLMDAVDAEFTRIPVLTARRGDLAAIETPDGPALAVVIGAHMAGMGSNGLVFPRLDAAIAAWRV